MKQREDRFLKGGEDDELPDTYTIPSNQGQGVDSNNQLLAEDRGGHGGNTETEDS